MQAALIVAPAPFCGQLLRAGAALFHAAARLFAAKETSKATAQDDVSARAAQILDAHGNAILRYAYSYLHNMADAEEVLQDTLVQFLKTAPRFESEAHEKAWLLRVAGNLSKNRLLHVHPFHKILVRHQIQLSRKQHLLAILPAVGFKDRFRFFHARPLKCQHDQDFFFQCHGIQVKILAGFPQGLHRLHRSVVT